MAVFGCNNVTADDQPASLSIRMDALAAESPGFVAFNRFILIISLVWVFACLIAWFAFKDRFERTRVRPTALVIMLSIGTVLCVLVNHLQVAAGFLYPCLLLAVMLALIVPFVAGAIAARMVMFYFLSVFSHEVASSALSKMSETGFAYDVFEDSSDPVASFCMNELEVTRLILRMVVWAPLDEERSNDERQKMLKALRFVTSKWGALSIVATLEIPSFITIIAVGISNLSQSECTECASVMSAILYTMIVLGVVIITITLIMWKRVYHLPDPWGLRAECAYLLILAIASMMWFMIDFFVPAQSAEAYFVLTHLLTATLVLAVAVSTILQLWLGYRQTQARRRKGSSMSSTASQGLDEILANPVSAAAFEKHLVSELGIESLLFVRDAESWKKTYFDIAPSARKARAKKMHATYIAPSGIYAINIPDFMMREVASKLNKDEDDVEPTLFDAALKEIKHLLQVGAVTRFLDAPQNRKLHKSTAPARNSVVALQSSMA